MGSLKPVHGVPWSDGVVANCRWGGARLRDVLQHLNLLPDDNVDDLHVCFASFSTLCQDDEYYGSSIPLAKATNMDPGVILAYEVRLRVLSTELEGRLKLMPDERRRVVSRPWCTLARSCTWIPWRPLDQMGRHHFHFTFRITQLLPTT
jgi:hypothetical protein